MKQAFEKLSSRVITLFSILFGETARQADHAKLTRHIVALHKKPSSIEIINELSLCLKDILNYRLFAFVVQKEAGVDVWLDPKMYKASMEDIILQDFNIDCPADLTYLNHSFDPDEQQEKFSLRDLIYYELNEDDCYARLYMLPHKPMSPYHDEVVNLILMGCSSALSNQLKIERLKDAAVIDPLTGCYNRREFENQLRRNIAGATRHKSNLSAFMFDLDHFKQINDTYGHLGGDLVLKEVAILVKENIRKGDILARYGGEEFIAILPETDKTKAMELADRLRCRIADMRIPYNDTTIRVTASFGVSELIHNTDISRLIEDADTMLYKAKLNGRNQVMPGLIKICPPKESLFREQIRQ